MNRYIYLGDNKIAGPYDENDKTRFILDSPIYEVIGNHSWYKFQILELDKDFRLEESPIGYDRVNRKPTYKEVAIPINYTSLKVEGDDDLVVKVRQDEASPVATLVSNSSNSIQQRGWSDSDMVAFGNWLLQHKILAEASEITIGNLTAFKIQNKRSPVIFYFPDLLIEKMACAMVSLCFDRGEIFKIGFKKAVELINLKVSKRDILK